MKKDSEDAILKELSGFRDMVAEEFIGFKKEVKEQFEQIDGRFSGIDEKLEKIEKTLNNHTEILDHHTVMLTKLDQERLAGIHRGDRQQSEIDVIKKELKLA